MSDLVLGLPVDTTGLEDSDIVTDQYDTLRWNALHPQLTAITNLANAINQLAERDNG